MHIVDVVIKRKNYLGFSEAVVLSSEWEGAVLRCKMIKCFL